MIVCRKQGNEMKKKQQSKRVIAQILLLCLCFASFGISGEDVAAADTLSAEHAETLKNPVMKEGTVIWDCVYFGNYWQSEYTPQSQPEPGEDVIHTDTDGTVYLVRKDGKCYRREPVKWRVLSVNEDASDVFLMADQVLDVAQYYRENVQTTWEQSDIRAWLGETFMETAFTPEEQAMVETTEVTTPANEWSNEPGGNDTEDKIYLPSIEEVRNPAYGFSSDVTEGDTRKITVTDYAEKGGTPNQPANGFTSYWLRSPGVSGGRPAQVGHWGEGEILTEPSVMLEWAAAYLGVRPVLHVDLSDQASYTYAGQVTPKGIFVPKEEEPAPDVTAQPVVPVQTPEITPAPTGTPQPVVEPEINKPGKPTIKKLKNKKGKKVTVTLSGKVSGASGYQVAYATKSSMKGQKIKSFKGTSVTIKGLKKKKTYYFCVRAYTKKNGKTVMGSWGKKKSIKIKK